jgi:hypothetical protein
MKTNNGFKYKFYCVKCDVSFDVVVNSSIQDLKIWHTCGEKAVCLQQKLLEDKINVSLTNKDLNRIFKWYDKGFTNIDEDSPLLKKLKKYYKEE